MRLVTVTFAFALLSLGFAPAPFPRAKHRDQQTPGERALRACEKRLDELGVRWQLTSRNGRDRVTFTFGGGGMIGFRLLSGGDLLPALRDVIRTVESRGP